MWTTCPRCKGSGFERVEIPASGLAPAVIYEDDCTFCFGDGALAFEDEENDVSSLDDVDVKDED
jgi:hypothetical protein